MNSLDPGKKSMNGAPGLERLQPRKDDMPIGGLVAAHDDDESGVMA